MMNISFSVNRKKFLLISVISLLVGVTLITTLANNNNNRKEDNSTQKEEDNDLYRPSLRAKPIATLNCQSSNIIEILPGATASLANAPLNQLCTLTRVNKNNSKEIAPVGRSYNNKNWEAVAGPYNAISYQCDGVKCDVQIPETINTVGGDEYVFQLRGYGNTQLSIEDEAARFFEQATFGVTKEDLNKVKSEVFEQIALKDYFVNWIDEQINEISPTSHRQTWRERTLPQYEVDINTGGREGRASRPCDEGSAWRAYAFTRYDGNKFIVVKEVQIDSLTIRYALEIDGKIRTMVDSFDLRGLKETRDPSESMTICDTKEGTYEKLRVRYKGSCYNVKGGNPPVDIQGIPEPYLLQGFHIGDNVVRQLGTSRIEYLDMKYSFSHSFCNLSDKNSFIRVNNGDSDQDLIFESQLVFQMNVPNAPLDDGGKDVVTASGNKALCPNAPRTFLNEKECQLSSRVACVSQNSSADQGSFQLDGDTLMALYEGTGTLLYAIKDLRVNSQYQEPPCTQGLRTRWEKVTDRQCVETNIHAHTAAAFRQLFDDSNDNNNFIKDLYLPVGRNCNAQDENLLEIELSLYGGQECWKTTHPDFMNVYDFTLWPESHPGGPEPIENLAANGFYELAFPASHDMSRWIGYKSKFPYVGRFGDVVQFGNLPYTLKTQKIATIVGLVGENEDTEYTVVCGSPYEANNKFTQSRSFAIESKSKFNTFSSNYYQQQKRTVWTMVTTASNDQLRQRIAWSLSQLFPISTEDQQYPHQTEKFLNYYDIFVRNAFGNYRDILKEVAFSPLMAQMLSFFESKSMEYNWNQIREVQFAGKIYVENQVTENFAREIMQLFSIGLEKLNADGTSKRDSNGKKIKTYSNDDIMEYARLWTGFTTHAQRGNIEMRGELNTIDPMRINLQWRDQVPKMGLDKKYIGDGFVLCSDLPSKTFLSAGAKYRLLGNTTRSDIIDTSSVQTIPQLQTSSSLFNLLCKFDSNGVCLFDSVVTLSEKLTCTGIECNLTQDPRIVKVGDNVYYEYIKPPCVNFPFSNSASERTVVIADDGKIGFARDEDPFGFSDTLTYFRVQWENDEFPNINNQCGSGVCELSQKSCLCKIGTADEQVFNSRPSREELLTELHTGAPSTDLKAYPNSISYGDFTVLYTGKDRFNVETVFEVMDNFGRTLFLKNMKSKAIILNWGNYADTNFSFRNPPSFYGDFPEVKDAHDETDAGLDHYFYHENTAPFVALHFIKRFIGISNPSPRYVSEVSQAFKSGRYEVPSTQGNVSFGSGNYGDLAATVAAILLDSESRDTSLDFDPSHGSIREPVIKVIALMRSMSYSQTDGEFKSIFDVNELIGQMAHDFSSIFSFFLPEYSPTGVMTKASLVSPESMLSQYSMGLVNGMLSMINFGMTQCFGGFGDGPCRSNDTTDVSASGFLTYTSPEDDGSSTDYAEVVVQDLATMLTSGRLNPSHRSVIKQAYLAANDHSKGLQMAQRLMILSPEFHQTGNVKENMETRPPIPAATKTCKEYKTIIHIQLKGGCDSFNMLVPHSQCRDGKDNYAEYMRVRGSIGLPKESLLPINAASSNQVCETFGIHSRLPFLKELYDQNELAFLAGIGVMTAPADKTNYQNVTETNLFSHNKMRGELHRLDPHNEAAGSGIFGRLLDVVSNQEGISSQAFSIDSDMAPIEGKRVDIKKVAVDSATGFKPFNPSFESNSVVLDSFESMNGIQDSHGSMYAETWSSSLYQSIHQNNLLSEAQDNVELLSQFPSTEIGQQLELVAKMIKSKDCRGSNRDVFHIPTGKYDHHSDLISNLEIQFEELNDALSALVSEMKSIPNDVWKNVVVTVSSDFGRTLTGNSKGGSDHAWSGNSFIIGGSINGGKILGSYPEDLTANGSLNVGRGRLIPTMPYEAPWQAVTEWLGMSVEETEEVLPNVRSFPDEMLLKEADVFVNSGTTTNSGCTGEGSLVFCA